MEHDQEMEECYVCGMTEDETWLKPSNDPDHEGDYICEECQSEVEPEDFREPDDYDDSRWARDGDYGEDRYFNSDY